MHSQPASPTLSTSSTSSSSEASPTTQTTNTIAITCLPRSYFTTNILTILRGHFETYGLIDQWVPLSGFGRIIVVYEHHSSAEIAREHCRYLQLPADDGKHIPLRIYRADPNPLRSKTERDSSFYLAPPTTEKNFLISPPGSPPIGWEQVQEDPPNSAPLAEDLIHALRKLELSQKSTKSEDGLEILLHPDEAGVGVFVEDCDPDKDEEEDQLRCYGEKQRWKPLATAMPPPVF